MANLKDSGERTEFSTGAVRDMHEGKGRFDLLPWNAIHDVAKHCEDGAKKYGERNVDKGIPQHSLIDSAIRHLVRYIHNEQDEPHLRAAAWNVLWALEQETTHPDMIDLPNRKSMAEDVEPVSEDECSDDDDKRLDRMICEVISDRIIDKCDEYDACIGCPLYSHFPDLNFECYDSDKLSKKELLRNYKILYGKNFGED